MFSLLIAAFGLGLAYPHLSKLYAARDYQTLGIYALIFVALPTLAWRGS